MKLVQWMMEGVEEQKGTRSYMETRTSFENHVAAY